MTISIRKIFQHYHRKSIIKFKKQFNIAHNILEDNDRFICPRSEIYPCFDTEGTYTFSTHYGYHTAWAARVLASQKPNKHVDISSCLRFVSLVSAFIPIDFYDYRPADIELSGMSSAQADLTALHFSDNSIQSLSCMHVVEHIGLGRYGNH